MLHSLESKLAILALLLACAYALLKGDAAERWGALLISISWIGADLLSLVLRGLTAPGQRELTYLVMDAALAAGMLGLAFRYAKIWLGVAMLMLSGELALHGAAMGDWGFAFENYIVFNNALSFALLALLIVATTLAWTRRSGTAGENPPPRLPSEQF